MLMGVRIPLFRSFHLQAKGKRRGDVKLDDLTKLKFVLLSPAVFTLSSLSFTIIPSLFYFTYLLRFLLVYRSSISKHSFYQSTQSSLSSIYRFLGLSFRDLSLQFFFLVYRFLSQHCPPSSSSLFQYRLDVLLLTILSFLLFCLLYSCLPLIILSPYFLHSLIFAFLFYCSPFKLSYRSFFCTVSPLSPSVTLLLVIIYVKNAVCSSFFQWFSLSTSYRVLS